MPETLPMAPKTDLPGIDIAKYIMAIAVVAIHIGVFQNRAYHPAIEWFIRLAVPFFFIVSGFFIARKLDEVPEEERRKILLRRGLQLLRIYAVWIIIYVPLVFVETDTVEVPAHYIVREQIINIFFRGETKLDWQLWYVYSLALVCLSLSFATGSRLRMILVGAVFTVSFITDYINIYRPEHLGHGIPAIANILTRRTFGGGIYVAGGFIIYRFRAYLKANPAAVSGVLLAASIALFCLRLPLWQFAGGVAVFIPALTCRPSRHCALYPALRSQSMWIYFTHMFAVVAAWKILGDEGAMIPVSFALAMALGYVMYRLQKTGRIPVLDKLIR